MTPPALVPFSDHGGDWGAYETELDRIFLADIVHAGIQFQGDRVGCRKHPETGGRWAAFWHLIQEGKIEDDRTPDLRRCERLRWASVCAGFVG